MENTRKTKLAVCIFGDHGSPSGYPSLIEVDSEAECVSHYTCEYTCNEEGMLSPVIKKEDIRSYEEFLKIQYDELVFLDDSIGYCNQDVDKDLLSDPKFWEEAEQYGK